MKDIGRIVLFLGSSVIASTARAQEELPEDYPPKCVSDDEITTGRCVPIDVPFGDDEVIPDRGDLLYVVNVGDDAQPYPLRGKNVVRLVKLDGATGLPVGSVRLADDYSGQAELNGPEFYVPPPSDPNDLGVVYHSAGAPRVVWRRRDAAWNAFSASAPFPFAPIEGYPTNAPPKGVGVISFFAVPDTSPDADTCPSGCTVDVATGVQTPIPFLLTEAGNTIVSRVDHPLDPRLWGAVGCDPTGACGLVVAAKDGVGGIDLSAPKVAGMAPNDEVTALAAGVQPDTGAPIWFALGARNRIRVFEETATTLRELTRPRSPEGYSPLRPGGPADHFEVAYGEGKLVLYYQVRGDPNEYAPAGTYTVEVTHDGARYRLEGPTKVSDCASGTELAYLERSARWATYDLSDDPAGLRQVYVCYVP